MKKTVLTLLALFALGIVAVAQSMPGQTSKGTESEMTVQGCLSHSGNGYTLTDKSGTTYHLTGDTSKLTEHVGHEVEIRGTASNSGEPSSPSSADSKAAIAQQIEVTGVKHISATCTSGSSTGKSPSDKSPMSEKPPMSENPPIPHP
ncbi:MAG TPA: DUF5818 domain-containing protein [Terriglobales bacterium]|nr:DUF5818 domain-containing protein [Terriglobales bacterium]